MVEIKDFNVLIDNKSFIDELVKNKHVASEKSVKMSRNIPGIFQEYSLSVPSVLQCSGHPENIEETF